MGLILEILLEVVLEFVLEFAGQLLVELGLRSLGEPFLNREDRNPVFAAVGYCLLGLILGGLSLFVFPHPFARTERFHGVSLIISPVLAGLAMAGVGWLRDRQGKPLIRLDSFAYGFLFAFAMSLVRFLYVD